MGARKRHAASRIVAAHAAPPLHAWQRTCRGRWRAVSPAIVKGKRGVRLREVTANRNGAATTELKDPAPTVASGCANSTR